MNTLSHVFRRPAGTRAWISVDGPPFLSGRATAKLVLLTGNSWPTCGRVFRFPVLAPSLRPVVWHQMEPAAGLRLHHCRLTA